MEVIVLVAMRLLAACILGCVSIETKNGRTTAD